MLRKEFELVFHGHGHTGPEDLNDDVERMNSNDERSEAAFVHEYYVIDPCFTSLAQ